MQNGLYAHQLFSPPVLAVNRSLISSTECTDSQQRGISYQQTCSDLRLTDFPVAMIGCAGDCSEWAKSREPSAAPISTNTESSMQTYTLKPTYYCHNNKQQMENDNFSLSNSWLKVPVFSRSRDHFWKNMILRFPLRLSTC